MRIHRSPNKAGALRKEFSCLIGVQVRVVQLQVGHFPPGKVQWPVPRKCSGLETKTKSNGVISRSPNMTLDHLREELFIEVDGGIDSECRPDDRDIYCDRVPELTDVQ